MPRKRSKPGKTRAKEPAGSSTAPETASLSSVAHLQLYQEELRAQNEHLQATQRELERSRDRYAQLYDNAPVGYVTLDINGVIEEANLTAAGLLGRDRQTLLGMPLLALADKCCAQDILGHVMRCRHAQQCVQTEVQLRRADGAPLYVQLHTIQARRDRLGGVQYFTSIIDITEQRRLESERRRVEAEARDLAIREQAAQAASEAKDRFLAVLSHELRTPLTPILAAVTALESLEHIPDELRATINMVRRNVEMEARLIDDLLDVTRIARNKMRLTFAHVDVHTLLSETIRMLASNSGRKLSIREQFHARSHFVSADAGRLRQVFWNLLNNAIKFTPDGGTITVRTLNQPPHPALHLPAGTPQGTQPAGPALIVHVSDTGLGIDPSILPKLFQAFEQVEQKNGRRTGLGLGLAICKGLAGAHGGFIHADSAGLGKGSTFSLELLTVHPPAEQVLSPHARPLPAARAPRPVPQPAAHRPRILLVEDHPDTARIMSRLLSAEGYSVTVAHTLKAALREAENAPDLVISDIGLPDGTGLELMQKLQQKRPVHGVAISGFGTEQDIRRSKDAGFDEHLTKPVEFSTLLEVVHRLTAPQAQVAQA